MTPRMREVSSGDEHAFEDQRIGLAPILTIHVDESPVGVGKTERAIRHALQFPARWLFAVERREAVTELADRFAASEFIGNQTKIVLIRSVETVRGYSVRQEVEALPDRYENGHVIAICTHEALLMSDLTGFAGWHLVVDEVPRVLVTQQVQSKVDFGFFQTHYALTHLRGAWSKVTLTEAGRAITGSDLFQDDSHRHLRLFHQRVTRSTDAERAVICNLRRWEEMCEPDVIWIWWSLFSATELSPFETVQFLGNGFMNSVATKMMRVWAPKVIWKAISRAGEREIVRRKVSVRYFSEERRASKSFFVSENGARALRAIGQHVAHQVPRDRLIWSSNECAKDSLTQHLPRSAYLSPKQAGTSQWMACTHAAMFYAAKPNSNVRSVLDAIGIEHNAWIETNEYETVLQFVTRTSIRDVRSAEHANVYVFDRWQADYIMSFLSTQHHINADVEWVDLALDFERQKPGPKIKAIAPDEAARRAEARRAAKAASECARRAKLKAAGQRHVGP